MFAPSPPSLFAPLPSLFACCAARFLSCALCCALDHGAAVCGACWCPCFFCDHVPAFVHAFAASTSPFDSLQVTQPFIPSAEYHPQRPHAHDGINLLRKTLSAKLLGSDPWCAESTAMCLLSTATSNLCGFSSDLRTAQRLLRCLRCHGGEFVVGSRWKSTQSQCTRSTTKFDPDLNRNAYLTIR